jgi:hypothetical protein
MRAWQAADVPGLVALLRHDADMAMPPTPSWYHGRDNIGVYLRQLFGSPFGRDLELVPTAANRQPALAVYGPTGSDSARRPFAVKVFTMDGDRISAITGFVSPQVFASFGLNHTPLSEHQCPFRTIAGVGADAGPAHLALGVVDLCVPRRRRMPCGARHPTRAPGVFGRLSIEVI